MKLGKLNDILSELDAGILLNKVARSFADVAFGSVATGKGGKVVLTFDLMQIDTSNRINVAEPV
jgi:hypothetical protein